MTHEYDDGDGKVEYLGEIKLLDGSVFNGVIVTFPVSPPKLPIKIIWDGTPVRITLKEQRS